MADTTTNPGGENDLRKKTQQSPLASQREEGKNNLGRKNRMSTIFPMGYKESFGQWWANVPPATAEHNVLSFIPFLKKPPTHTHTGTDPPSTTPSVASASNNSIHKASPVKTNSQTDPHGPRQWHSNLVQLNGSNRSLNEFSVERLGEKSDQNLVMLHGYGAGLGFFYKNFEGLSRVPGWKIYALDLLGMGRSTRPPFKLKSKDRQKCISEAEDWFVDSLEEWRIKRNIDRFTLMGHSLGGYMAVAYALKYPGHLNKLVLASPVGIPEDPYAVKADLPEPSGSTMANEFSQDQKADIKETSNPKIPEAAKVGDNNNFLNARKKREAADEDGQGSSAPRKPLPKWLTYLWDANVSPFGLVRWSGPLGPALTSGWTSRRFSQMGSDEAKALHTYAYSLFRLRGSGEYALAYILAPGAFARSPLIRRIAGVGRQYLQPNCSVSSTVGSAERKRENGFPIVFMYGENDWMDVAGGFAAEQKLNEEKKRILKDSTADQRRQDRGSAKVVVIQKAGHHVYLDGWEEFNEVMRKEMEDLSTPAQEA